MRTGGTGHLFFLFVFVSKTCAWPKKSMFLRDTIHITVYFVFGTAVVERAGLASTIPSFFHVESKIACITGRYRLQTCEYGIQCVHPVTTKGMHFKSA